MNAIVFLLLVCIIQIFLAPAKPLRYRNVDSVIAAFWFLVAAFAFDIIAALLSMSSLYDLFGLFVLAEGIVLSLIKIITKRKDSLIKYGIPQKYTMGHRYSLINRFYSLEQRTPIVYTRSSTAQFFGVAACSTVLLAGIFTYQAFKYPSIRNTVFIPIAAAALLAFLVEFCIFCFGASEWDKLHKRYKMSLKCKNRRQLAKMRFSALSDFSYIFMKNFVWEKLHIMRATKFNWKKSAFENHISYYDFTKRSKSSYETKEYNPELEAFITSNNLEPNELYVTAYSLIDRNENVLLKTPSYAEFEPYLIALIKMKVAKTQKIVLVVSNDEKKAITASKINGAFKEYMGFDEIPLMQTIDECVKSRKLEKQRVEKADEERRNSSHFSVLTAGGDVPVDTDAFRPVKAPDIVITAPEDICNPENAEFVREIIDALGLIIYYDFSDSVQEEALFAKIIHSVLDYNDKISTLYMTDSFFDLEQVIDNFFSKRNLYEIKVSRAPSAASYVMGWKAENINEMQSRTNPDASRDMGNHIPILYDAGACTENDFIVVEDEFDTYVENQLNFSDESITSRLDYHVGWTDVIGGNSAMCTVSDTYNNVAHTYLAMTGVGSSSEYINIISRPYLLRNYLMYHLRYFTLYPGVLSSYSPGLIKTQKALAYEAVVKLFVVGCTKEQLLRYVEITSVDCEPEPEEIVKALVACAGCENVELLEITTDSRERYHINEAIYKEIIDKTGLIEKIEFWTNRQVYIRNKREYSYLLPHQKIVLNGVKYTVEKIEGNRVELTDSNTREPMYITRPVRTCKMKVNDVEEYGSRIQNNNSSSISFSRLTADVEISTYGNIIFKDCYRPFCKDSHYDYQCVTEPQVKRYENINVFTIDIGSHRINSENSARLSKLLALLLNEMLPTFFPRQGNRIVVACKGWNISPDFGKETISTAHTVAQMDIDSPKESSEDRISLYILEDSPVETGLVNVFWQDEEVRYMLKVLEDYLYYLKYINRRERKELFDDSYVKDLTLLKRILLEVINETFKAYDQDFDETNAFENKIRVSRNKFNRLDVTKTFDIYCDYCGKKIQQKSSDGHDYHFYAYSGLVSCMDCYSTAVCGEKHDKQAIRGLAEAVNKWFEKKYKDSVVLDFYNYLEDAERVTEISTSPNEDRYIVTDDSDTDEMVLGVAATAFNGKTGDIGIFGNSEFIAVTGDCNQEIPGFVDSVRASYLIEDDAHPYILIRDGLPFISYMGTLSHEMTHQWQYQNLDMEKLAHNVPSGGVSEFGQSVDLTSYRSEGHAEWESVRYLRNHGGRKAARQKVRVLNVDRSEYGAGYRWMRNMMKFGHDDLRIPAARTFGFILKRNYYQLTKNSFALMRLYFEGATANNGDDGVPSPQPPQIPTDPPEVKPVGDADKGLPYVPETYDRTTYENVAYYYRNTLSESEKGLYDQVLRGIKSFEEKITVDDTSAVLGKIIPSVRDDHPEIFWLESAATSGREVFFYYNTKREDVAEVQKHMEPTIAKYLAGINDSMSAYDVALHFHMTLINSIDYDTVALENESRDGGIDYIRTICGVFLNGKAVCAGYAKALQYLLQKCGVECAYVTGHILKEEDGGHAWNMVKIDGDYYYVDTTWDDSSNTSQEVKNTDVEFDYFCVTTEEMSRSRTPDLAPTEMPACVAKRANYYYHNNLVIDSYDIEKLKVMASDAARAGRSTVTFKCSTVEVYAEAYLHLFMDGQDCYVLLEEAKKADPAIDASSCTHWADENIRTVTLKFKK